MYNEPDCSPLLQSSLQSDTLVLWLGQPETTVNKQIVTFSWPKTTVNIQILKFGQPKTTVNILPSLALPKFV
jgi:hypothetical protein